MLAVTKPNRLATPGTSPGAGHNHPPSAIELAKLTIEALGAFLQDHPVIVNEAEAREAKLIKDRADMALREVEAERDAHVRPLNEEVASINTVYHRWHNTNPKKPGTWDTLLSELRVRLTAYVSAEERRRQAAAEAARRLAAEAACKAREAEERERAAAAEARDGVCTDIAAMTAEADHAFAQFERAERQAIRAQEATHVRLTGGFGKAASLRTHEILAVTDWRAAIEEMGLTDPLREAIITAARAYRKAFGELPDGISRTKERSI